MFARGTLLPLRSSSAPKSLPLLHFYKWRLAALVSPGAALAHESVMDANQYRAAIKALGLNQSQAARFLDIAVSTSHGYAQGTGVVPEQIAMLLSVMLHLEISPVEARQIAGLPVNEYSDRRATKARAKSR